MSHDPHAKLAADWARLGCMLNVPPARRTPDLELLLLETGSRRARNSRLLILPPQLGCSATVSLSPSAGLPCWYVSVLPRKIAPSWECFSTGSAPKIRATCTALTRPSHNADPPVIPGPFLISTAKTRCCVTLRKNAHLPFPAAGAAGWNPLSPISMPFVLLNGWHSTTHPSPFAPSAAETSSPRLPPTCMPESAMPSASQPLPGAITHHDPPSATPSENSNSPASLRSSPVAGRAPSPSPARNPDVRSSRFSVPAPTFDIHPLIN